MKDYFFVFAGGGVGSILRFMMSKLVNPYAISFPVATLISNLFSCFLLGFFVVMAKNKFMEYPVPPLLIVGFCGGLSTFSSFSFETYQLIQQSNYFYAGINILLSILICILAIYVGIKTGRMF
jgi:CrcB protein